LRFKVNEKIGFMVISCFAKQFSIVIGTNGTEEKLNSDKFQDYFYESLKAKQ
jgi:hypothetical protein